MSLLNSNEAAAPFLHPLEVWFQIALRGGSGGHRGLSLLVYSPGVVIVLIHVLQPFCGQQTVELMALRHQGWLFGGPLLGLPHRLVLELGDIYILLEVV